MAKITDQDRYKYLEKTKPYRAAIDRFLSWEQDALLAIRQDVSGGAMRRLALVNDMLNLASNYMVLSGISHSVLKLKNEDALNDARKSLYKSVIYLEGIVSSLIDAPYSDYGEQLAAIDSLSAARRYLLVRKMGMAIDLLENAYGDNTKWRWAFVELEGRFTAVAKNILNLRGAVVNTDPRSPDYEPLTYHLRLVKKLLARAANRYREKYELSTNRTDDFKTGIAFLSALKRLHLVMNEQEEAAAVKKKLDIWAAKLEADIKKQDEAYLKKPGA